MGSRAAEWDDTDRHIIRSWLRLQHHLCTKCGRPWAVHDTDHVDDYSVGYLTCTATEAIAIEQAAQHAKDEPDIKRGLNPDAARQWTSWTRDEGPPSTALPD